MSLQPKSIWMPRDARSLTDGDMSYDSSSRIEPKRGQWFMDSNGLQSFSKKQAIEAVNGRPVSGVPHMNVAPSHWDTNSGFQSVPGQCNERLFGSEQIRSGNLVDRNIQSVGGGNMNMGRKGFESQFGSTPSAGLSMSHTIEDPSSCLSFGGIRKVKVNEVRESENILNASMGHSYDRVDSSSIELGNSYNKSDNNSISLGPTYNSGEESTVSMASTYTKANESYISAGNTFNKGDGNFISMGHSYNNSNNGLLSMGQSYDKGDRNFISMGQSYEKGDGNIMSLSTSFNKRHEDFMSIAASYDKPDDSFIQMAPSFLKGNDNIISMAQTYKVESGAVPTGPNYDQGESNNRTMGQNYNKSESTTISFGGFHEEPETNASGGILSGYDLLMSNQNSSRTSEVSEQKNSPESSLDRIINSIAKADSKADKNKEPKAVKKPPPNNFPSNVKSLLSTGMFDGVPVKYVSWSRDKNLKGVIKGTGYLCSCAKCNHSKSLNAYEYERHAGCKTKHPNNHIYFENGKTIYAVVQELKNAPQQTLFDAIQNVTGSLINQKNFRVWKASYQAATRELQRIYGKDEVTLPS